MNLAAQQKTFDKLLEGPTKKPTFSTEVSAGVFLLTIPEVRYILKYWNNKDIPNRDVKLRKVQEYAEDMKKGRWVFTGEAIIFSTGLSLLNGQHRLYAVLMAAMETFQTTVSTGVTLPAFKKIDGLKPRNLADVLKSEGFKEDPTVLATAIKLTWAWDNDRMRSAANRSGDSFFTNYEALETVDAHPELTECLSKYKGATRGISSHGANAFLYWLLVRSGDLTPNGKKKAEDYLDKVLLGHNLEPNTIEDTLRQKLLNNALKPTGSKKMNVQERLANIIIGWRKVSGLSSRKSHNTNWTRAQKFPKLST